MADRQFDIVVVGELNADLILSGDVVPAFGQVEKWIDRADLAIGSSAGIFACGAARLGLKVAFIGKVGADPFGDFMRQAIASRGIDTSAVQVDPSIKTGLTVILNRGTDRAILTFPGSIPLLRYDEIDLDCVGQARHLHLGSYYLLDQLRPDIPRLFLEAHRRGLTVSIDTNYDPLERWDAGIQPALTHADVFLPNETELLAISQAPDIPTGMQRIASLGPAVVVKQGGQGATGLWRGQRCHADTIPVQVVDTVGAGDSFDAGFLYGYLQRDPDWDFQRMLRMGCICGALSTRAAGGTTAQPDWDEARTYLPE
jgi:sugar/nucleoside kinase (ribokinase family)